MVCHIGAVYTCRHREILSIDNHLMTLVNDCHLVAAGVVLFGVTTKRGKMCSGVLECL